MSLSNYDRDLLERCLAKKNGAWEDFVDRFTGLVISVIRHASETRSIDLGKDDTEDLLAEVFMQLIAKDYSVLRKFRGESSLATYLAVVARRIVIRQLLRHQYHQPTDMDLANVESGQSDVELRIKREELLKILESLDEQERTVVQMFHLDGKTYEEIHAETDIPVNSIGPLLSKARKKLKEQNQRAVRD